MNRPAAVLLLLLAACSGGERDVEGRPSEVLPQVEVTPAPHIEAPALYDDEGNLRESETRVAGLTLPMGLTPNAGDDERLHTYLSDVPIGALLRYFGPRLTTGEVAELPGHGASYRAAVPREVTTGAVPLDVTVMPVPGHTLVEIRERPPAPANPPPESEALRDLAAAMQAAE